jgi:hypothetical protein
MKKMFIGIEIAAVIALAIYFIPIWWTENTAILWAPGLLITLATTIGLFRRYRAARYVAGVICAIVGIGLIGFGSIGISTSGSPLEERLIMRSLVAWLNIVGTVMVILGGLYTILFLRLFLGKYEGQYFDRQLRVQPER